jgi:hypothetical protein
MLDKHTSSKANDKSFAHTQTTTTTTIECQYVDKLPLLLGYVNRHILKNFRINLVMENKCLESKAEEFKLK